MSEFRTYASLRTAKIAVNREDLGRNVVRYDEGMSGRIRPVILCDTHEEVAAAKKLGFHAEKKPNVFCEGATVRLKDSVPKGRSGELACIERFVRKIGGHAVQGAVYLDRRIGGTRWWNVADLVLIEPGVA